MPRPVRRALPDLISAQLWPTMAFHFMTGPKTTQAGDTPSAVSLRPEQPDDDAFLYEVYASTREEELALTNWDENMRRIFLNHQFNAMRQGYRSMFPQGEFLIVNVDDKPAGRMVIHRGEGEIRVVDLALLPVCRNRGFGTFLMRQICAQADRPVRLSVLKFNRAVHWYQRLGFAKTGEMGIYDEMEWRPSVNSTSAPG